MSKKRAAFGSFHSDNVEDMIKDGGWKPPAEPGDVASSEDHSSVDYKFGREAKGLFLLDQDWVFVNHGAFGSPLRTSFESANRWRVHAERQPLRFIDRELFPHMVRSLKLMSDTLDCRPADLALVPNATLALNAVFESVPLTSKDSIFYLDTTYNSVKKMIRAACERTGATHVQKDLSFPLPMGREKAHIIETVEKGLPKGCKLAVFDHVTSNEGLVMPVKELVEVCHKRNILVLVDAAHGLGCVESFSVSGTGAEYVAGNCHKWFSSVRGAGFLCVDHRRLESIASLHQPEGGAKKQKLAPMVCSDKTCERGGPDVSMVWGSVRQPIISHGHGQGFASEFIWDGARDYSAALALPACIAFWQRVGLQKAQDYAHSLVRYAVEKMSKRWGTQGGPYPESMMGTMALVPLPVEAETLAGNLGDAARALQDALHEKRVECPAKAVCGKLYLRISAWIYNEPRDYLMLARAVDEVVGSKGMGDQEWAASVDKDAKQLADSYTPLPRD